MRPVEAAVLRIAIRSVMLFAVADHRLDDRVVVTNDAHRVTLGVGQIDVAIRCLEMQGPFIIMGGMRKDGLWRKPCPKGNAPNFTTSLCLMNRLLKNSIK